MKDLQQEFDWYTEGRMDGETATRSRGGTRGARWNAEQLGLEGDAKYNYIQGFNDVLDEFEEYQEEQDQE